MSLDVHLTSLTLVDKTCPHCGSRYQEVEELFNANITHNLGEMARKAGIYHYLWRPEEIDITFASELIDPLITPPPILGIKLFVCIGVLFEFFKAKG